MKSFLLIVALSITLSACYNSERNTTQINTTFGQELMDLKKALDSGAINNEQYKKILNRLTERRLKLNLEAADH